MAIRQLQIWRRLGQIRLSWYHGVRCALQRTGTDPSLLVSDMLNCDHGASAVTQRTGTVICNTAINVSEWCKSAGPGVHFQSPGLLQLGNLIRVS